MDLSIWKFPLKVEDITDVVMPAGCKILSLQSQGMTPCIWALCNPATVAMEKRRFRTFGTGHPIDKYELASLSFVGTYQLQGGRFVFHVFVEEID